MAGIAPLKAHLLKTTYNERSQPSMVADSSPEVLLIVHAGDSAVYTVPIESYTLFLTRFFYALLVLLYTEQLTTKAKQRPGQRQRKAERFPMMQHTTINSTVTIR